MRLAGYRTFRFPAGEVHPLRAYRMTVPLRLAPPWWRMWVRCRPADIRWASSQTASAHSDRFTALALEHASARRQDRAPDPEVAPIKIGPWWPRTLTAAELIAGMLGGVVWASGLAALTLACLHVSGVLRVEVTW